MQQYHPFRHEKIMSANFSKPIAYIILLLLSYALGNYMSPLVSVTSSNNDSPYSGPSPLDPIPTTLRSAVLQSDNNNTDEHVHDQHEHPQVYDDVHEHDGTKFEDHYHFGTVCAADLAAVPNSKLVRQTIIDSVFNGISPWNNFPPSHVAGLLRRSRMKGWGSRGAVFSNLIQKVKPMIIIELGTFLGASALHMVELTRQLNLPDTQILCIDDFRGWPGFQMMKGLNGIEMVNGDVILMHQFMKNVVNANATESVMFMPFSTGSALEKLCEWGVYGDLIEVDASHDFHSAWADINRAYKILRPGGILFGHDYLNNADKRGVRRAVDMFARIKNLQVKIDGQHWVLTPPENQSLISHNSFN